MASSMTKISSTTLTSNGNVTFTGIPQTYTDLMVKISAADSSGNQTIFMLVNADSGSNYSERILKAYAGSNVTSSTSSPRANIYSYAVGDIPTVGSLIQNNAEIYFPNYTSSNYKTMSYDSVQNSNTVALDELNMIAGRWNSTSAITGLTFYAGGASLATSTNITIYGITKYAETGTGSKATGGTVTTSGGYTIHTFYSSGMFTPTTNVNVDYLVVAGGGGSGTYRGGGGGAGGLLTSTSYSTTSGTGYAVIIGAGGGAGSAASGTGADSNGTSSSFATITATGGGAGSAYWSAGAHYAVIGGSGGGGAAYGGAYLTGAAGTAGQGLAGGNGDAGDGGGGGGGAGAIGANAVYNTTGGNGGIGLTSSYSGTSTYYAGGGGGAYASGSVQQGVGGLGGGGNASHNTNATQLGIPNTGGGAGGGGDYANGKGANGGSGIVIIRYTT